MSSFVFAPLGAQSCAQQHKIGVMNRGSSLVYKISHLNKISRSNTLNKAPRQPCAGLMSLGTQEQKHTGWFTGSGCRESKSRANYTVGLLWSFLKNLALFLNESVSAVQLL